MQANINHISEKVENEWSQCLHRNDQSGFSRLYDVYSGALFGLIVKRINNFEGAENLLCDVFVKAWSSRFGYDASKARIFTWLSSIAREVCIDYLRSKVSVENEELFVLTKNIDNISCNSCDLGKLTNNRENDERKMKATDVKRFA